MARRKLIVPEMSDVAHGLREVFDDRFRNPRSAHSGRFVWDYWHVSGQYTYIRTRAPEYFPHPIFQRFLEGLTHWSKAVLGCTSTTVPWLSYYVDGCIQEIHSDVPHGPWAWVFSLTDWERRRFTGGETLLLSQAVMDSSCAVDPAAIPRERDGIFESIPACFNQLTVFDGRIPHGVARVEGVRDPIHSRVVMHGWFRRPVLSTTGGISYEQASNAAAEAESILHTSLGKEVRAFGDLILRLSISRSGVVERIETLTDSIRTRDPTVRDGVIADVVDVLASRSFDGIKERATITVPAFFSQEPPFLKIVRGQTTTKVTTAAEVFDVLLPGRIEARREALTKLRGICRFVVQDQGLVWRIQLGTPSGATVTEGDGAGDCTVTITENDLIAVVSGEVDVETAFLTKRLEVMGELHLAAQLLPLVEAELK